CASRNSCSDPCACPGLGCKFSSVPPSPMSHQMTSMPARIAGNLAGVAAPGRSAATGIATGIATAIALVTCIVTALALPRPAGAQELVRDSLPGLRLSWDLVRVPAGEVRLPAGDSAITVPVESFLI